MINPNFSLGVVDNRFLLKSIGLLNPKPPVTMDQNQPLIKVIETLKNLAIGCVIIINDNSEIAGIFTERDILLKVINSSINIESTTVSQVMTANPKTAEMTTPIAFALNMMSQGGYRHIPIVDQDNFPIAIISVKDIVDYIVKSFAHGVSIFDPS